MTSTLAFIDTETTPGPMCLCRLTSDRGQTEGGVGWKVPRLWSGRSVLRVGAEVRTMSLRRREGARGVGRGPRSSTGARATLCLRAAQAPTRCSDRRVWRCVSMLRRDRDGVPHDRPRQRRRQCSSSIIDDEWTTHRIIRVLPMARSEPLSGRVRSAVSQLQLCEEPRRMSS